MDVPAVAAGPWIALGAVLGALLLLAAGAIVLRLRSPAPPEPATPPTPDEPRDDLADFLAHPPGTRGVPADDGDGWVPLAPSAPPAPREEPAPGPTGARPVGVLAGLAVGALLLVGTAAALAAAQRSPAAAPDKPAATAAPSSASPSGDGVVARLAFDGVVLEEHAVGITAAYPELELTVDDEGRELARLRLPAANCLALAAPPEPGDPGCRAARTEYAELAAPGLRVDRDGDRLAVSGRFATYRRPPGAPAEPTRRTYEVSVTVAAAGGEDAGWRPAEGELRWEDQRAGTREDGAPSVLRADG
ncbi:hypothetical protein [Blastococcus aurantiacus]|nr:hypothetical protein [Blastococcus aurantiacus]